MNKTDRPISLLLKNTRNNFKIPQNQKVTWATEWFDPRAIATTSPSLFEFLSVNLVRSTGDTILNDTLLFPFPVPNYPSLPLPHIQTLLSSETKAVCPPPH